MNLIQLVRNLLFHLKSEILTTRLLEKKLVKTSNINNLYKIKKSTLISLSVIMFNNFGTD
jgi:hypothetical protein